MKNILQKSFKIFGILVTLIIFISCEKDDLLLKDQIIGTWKSTNSYYKSYTFNEDNTFIDTAFYLPTDDPFYFEVNEIISGNYKIEEGQLYFSNIQLVYFKDQDSEHLLGHSTQYAPVYTISSSEDILILNQKDIFESINKTSSGIIGTWSHDKLAAIYGKDLENKFTGGTVHCIYDFKSDLSLDVQYKVLYDNTSDNTNSTTTYEFNNPLLSINKWGLYNVSVSFQKNKMVWIHNDRTFQRIQ